MTFVITYCDPSHANSAGVTVADSAPGVREAVERLRREGYQGASGARLAVTAAGAGAR
jgi:hypothetical protein